MTALGGNPARILPVWRDFVDAHAGRGKRVRGIGEPVWPGRSAAEVEECVCHESLLNVAFAECEDFWLVCPYDVTALDPAAVATARVTHPLVIEDGAVSPSPHYSVERHLLSPPLAEPDVDASMLDFDGDRLAQVRALVAQHAEWAGLGAERIKDLLVAANEVATNSIRHGGGSGTVRVWRDDGALVCEIRDRGYMTDPLIGRRRPANLQGGGYGVWIVNQLCDLVQIRSSADGSVVRMTARR
jgi:anti-sigma regulatory factor (Ser/Thr protein kinase)